MPFLILVLPAFLGMDLTLSVRYLLRPSSYRSRRAKTYAVSSGSLDNLPGLIQPSTARIQRTFGSVLTDPIYMQGLQDIPTIQDL